MYEGKNEAIYNYKKIKAVLHLLPQTHTLSLPPFSALGRGRELSKDREAILPISDNI